MELTVLLWFRQFCSCEKLVANLIRYIHHRDDKSGRAVQGMKCLRSLKHWGPEFQSYWRHGCMCLFCVCAVLNIGSGLVTS
jgi:hypothetical protein